MTEKAEPATTLPNVAVIGTLAFLACCFMFSYLAYVGVSRTGLMAPVVLGWVIGLLTMRPLVDREKRASLYFAFGVSALMIFFVHQTYGYTGQVRNFPLIVGYTGIVLSILDVLGLSNTAMSAAIARLFGSHLDVTALGGRRIKRELIASAAMGGCVLGIWLLGFLFFTPIFVALWMLAGGKKVKNALYGGIFAVLFIYLLFELAFKYDLYRGIIFISLLDL
ncbi:MAG: hypothetical protein O3C34_07830 [Proteobacteria bacterium]|nr:hypothetical protein [Pseudomonadota bacterium]